MKYFNARGLELSAFMLGTVQLGMEYGLGDDRAKPTQEKAFAILDRAMELGINTLDTADDYGDAEFLIGHWLEKRRREGKALPRVVTKISKLNHGSYDTVRDDILRKVERCADNLGVETLDCLMIHSYEDYANDRDNVQKVFEELKRDNRYRLNAISAYSRHDYGVIADSGFDAAQIPINALDWTQMENGGIEKLNRAGVMIFARSVYLQGLIFKTRRTLEPHMDFCADAVETYHRLCREFEMEPAVLAMSFVLSMPGVAAVVLGSDNARQLESNVQLFNQTVDLTAEQLETLRDAFRNIDPRVINPGVWRK